MGKRKRDGLNLFPRKSRAISFVGKDGYDIMDFFDREGEKFEYGKSGLIIELLKIYKESIEVYGEENAIFKMRFNIEKDRMKE